MYNLITQVDQNILVYFEKRPLQRRHILNVFESARKTKLIKVLKYRKYEDCEVSSSFN